MTNENKRARIQAIVTMLQQRNGASIKQLAQELDVTEMTIRRDIHVLQLNDLVNIFHGSVVLNPDKASADGALTYNIFSSGGVMEREKDLIGKEAAKLIKEGDVLFIDSGTTTEALVRHLQSELDISVICFSLNILEELKRKKISKLIFGGGYYHPETQAFECDEMVQFISGIRANKAFLSASGISRSLGFTCVKKYEEKLKKTFISNAGQRIVLADSSKFDVVKPLYYGSFSQIDTIITDHKLSKEWQEYLENEKVDCILSR
ncbi:MAG: DeoR/GlpR family DNA-binding transcription regulator [Sphaerochaetaceae bacterium]|nr:DeoR/GlpR family DNA-binding transcription regulator [Sphaerochaetaceae bacterium]